MAGRSASILSSQSLVAAAVAIGRLPGEPAEILASVAQPNLLAILFGTRRRGPLADPRLEVLRAISASLSRGAAAIRRDLVVAASQVGWTTDDLRRTFPDVAVRPF